jgi:hypothetical protein
MNVTCGAATAGIRWPMFQLRRTTIGAAPAALNLRLCEGLSK